MPDKYRLVDGSAVVKNEQDIVVKDSTNPRWQEYLAWLNAGNTPDPPLPPPVFQGTAPTAHSHNVNDVVGAIEQINQVQQNINTKQALSQILTAIAALTTVGILEIKSDGTAATVQVTAAARTLLDDADIPAIRTTLGLGSAATRASTDFEVSGSVATHKSESNAHAISQVNGLTSALDTKQALSQVLSAIAALTNSGVLQIKSDGTASTFVVSDAAKTLLDDPDIAAIRSTLQLKGAALLDVGTGPNTVAAGNDSRFNLTLPDTGIVAGSYTNPNVTFDSKGRATAASNGSAAGTGTVTSVGLALPTNIFSVTGSPITTNGTLTGALKTQTAALVFASPATGAAAAPTFRALVESDIPQLSTAKISNLAGGTWLDLPLSNGWSNPLLAMAASYIKLSDSLVMVRGTISKLTKPTSGETIATLPAGFRPSTARRFISANASNSSRPILEVSTAGVVSYLDIGTIPSSISDLLLSSIIFIGS